MTRTRRYASWRNRRVEVEGMEPFPSYFAAAGQLGIPYALLYQRLWRGGGVAKVDGRKVRFISEGKRESIELPAGRSPGGTARNSGVRGYSPVDRVPAE